MAPTANFFWRMASRARRWTEAWDAEKIQYDPIYATGRDLAVILDARGSSSSGSVVVSARWDIRGTDDRSFHRVITDTGGNLSPEEATTTLRPTTVTLPAQGRYRVTLTVRDKKGQASAPVAREIRVRDILIASIGDSAASGEGNPDENGDFLLDKAIDVTIVLDPFTSDPEPIWTDKRCHRSRFSGHAVAAALIEGADPTTSVTFLSFACSGATLGHLENEGYAGIDPPSPIVPALPLPPDPGAAAGDRPAQYRHPADHRRV